ncbi:hypothetical protein, partial [Methanobrevibacter cuticularis]
NKKFMPVYKKFIAFYKKEHKNKLPATNNITENYIGNTMPKAEKNKFRTGIGFMNQIYHRIFNWITTNSKQLTN